MLLYRIYYININRLIFITLRQENISKKSMSYLSRVFTKPPPNYGLLKKSKYFCTNSNNLTTCNRSNAARTLLYPFGILHQPPMASMTTIRIRSIKQDGLLQPGIMEHDKYNACLGRPLSPHIRIYKKQLTALLSFCHRLTGLMMVFYVYVVTAGTWLWPDITTFFDYLETLDTYVGEYWWTAGHRTVKFLVAYPFCFHSLNAIRHLSWDFGKLLGIKQIYTSGYLMQATVIVLALFLSFLVPFDLAEQQEGTEDEESPLEVCKRMVEHPAAAEKTAEEHDKKDNPKK